MNTCVTNLIQLIIRIGLTMLDMALMDPETGCLVKSEDLKDSQERKTLLAKSLLKAASLESVKSNPAIVGRLFLYIQLLDPQVLPKEQRKQAQVFMKIVSRASQRPVKNAIDN
ncbi:MAG TPA: hypothetical protein V6C52_03615 [Coleofasciculaceae cyanobacterium]